MRQSRPWLNVAVLGLVVGLVASACTGSTSGTDVLPSQSPNVLHQGPVPIPTGLQNSAVPNDSLTIVGADGPISPNNWMGDLFAAGKDDVKLSEVVIPGAHDAGTYGITCDSQILLPGTKNLSTYQTIATELEWNPVFVELAANKKFLEDFTNIGQEECPLPALTKAQADPTGGNSDGFISMMDGGIRFFDLRIYDNGEGPGGMDNFVFNHGLVVTNARVKAAIDNVLYFAASHPNDLIILDLHEVSGYDPEFTDATDDVDITALKQIFYDNIYDGGQEYFADRGVKGLCDLAISPKSLPDKTDDQAQLADWTLADMRRTTAGTAKDLNRNVLIMAQGGDPGGSADLMINSNCIWDEDQILQQKWANSTQWDDILQTAEEQLKSRGSQNQRNKFLLSQMQPTPAVPQYANCVSRGVLSPLTELEAIVGGAPASCSLLGLTEDVTKAPATYLPGWLDQEYRPNIMFADWVLLPDKNFFPDIVQGNQQKFGLR